MVPVRVAVLLVYLASGFGQDATSEAVQKYRADLQLDPQNSLLHFRLGELLFEQQHLQAAANEFSEALRGDPHPRWIDAWAHLDLGELFDLTEQRSRAIREYQAAAETKDDSEGVQALAARYLQKGVKAGEVSPHHVLSRCLSLPKLVVKTYPEYSHEARIAELEGTVLLTATILADGSAGEMRVAKTLGLGLDEAASAAVKQWTFKPGTTEKGPAPMMTTMELSFLLPAKSSRWHLLRVTFDAPAGGARPQFVKAIYPGRDGIGSGAAESARLLAAMGRPALVTLSFEIDPAGRPVHFRVPSATEPVWGNEAISFVRQWRFSPFQRAGQVGHVPCTLNLLWGERELTQQSLVKAIQAWELEAVRGSVP